MKVAIIIHSYCDSTFSFVEAWAAAGHSVDLYYVTDKSQILKDPGFQTDIINAKIGECRELTVKECRGVSQMLRYPGAHLFFYRIPNSDFSPKSKPLKWIKTTLLANHYVLHLGKIIKEKNYDCHEIIYPSSKLNVLLFRFNPQNTLLSFHEIIKNKNKTDVEWGDIHNSLKIALHRGFQLRFFSEAMKEGIRTFVPEGSPLFHVVPFGPYTLFRDFENDCTSNLEKLPKDYLLHFGYIFAYKGLDVLWEATERLKNENRTISVVVAGNGQLPVLDKMKSDSHYTVINRFIDNAEIVHLIKNCKAVVCPYIGCSQSGLPMTVYPFGKPIIATSIGDFPKVVPNNKTGLIIPPNDSEKLADAIDKLYTDNDLYNNLQNNVAHIDEICQNYSWHSIVEKYESILQDLHNTPKIYQPVTTGYIKTIIKSIILG